MFQHYTLAPSAYVDEPWVVLTLDLPLFRPLLVVSVRGTLPQTWNRSSFTPGNFPKFMCSQCLFKRKFFLKRPLSRLLCNLLFMTFVSLVDSPTMLIGVNYCRSPFFLSPTIEVVAMSFHNRNPFTVEDLVTDRRLTKRTRQYSISWTRSYISVPSVNNEVVFFRTKSPLLFSQYDVSHESLHKLNVRPGSGNRNTLPLSDVWSWHSPWLRFLKDLTTTKPRFTLQILVPPKPFTPSVMYEYSFCSLGWHLSHYWTYSLRNRVSKKLLRLTLRPRDLPYWHPKTYSVLTQV